MQQMWSHIIYTASKNIATPAGPIGYLVSHGETRRTFYTEARKLTTCGRIAA